GPALLAALSLLAGFAPGGVSRLLVSPAASAVAGEAVNVKLVLWHGVNPAFLLSIGTVLAGLGLFAIQNRLRGALQKLTWKWGPAYFYDRSLDGMLALAKFQTRILQSGTLRYYLIAIVGTVILGGAWTLARIEGLHIPTANISDVRFYEVGLAVLILGAALAAVLSPSRLGAIAALGAAGAGVALIFLIFGAPDLAITQFAIEALTVILFVLTFYHLPKFKNLSPMRSRIRDVVISLLAGGLMTFLVLAAVDAEIADTVSHFYVENSLPKAYGRNIVNVILVDFRGLDTLGEITVLGVAGIGVYALLKFRKGKGSEK
ncbi:MAG TPA: hydrogen gas-evolving membrane-bound hydrogenase subunit E, partial [Anaerolineales bacterium]|nr:hydrogen gas-evolving membrane-bound hydrogenase subunit E [Anaerolineales bacterium]